MFRRKYAMPNFAFTNVPIHSDENAKKAIKNGEYTFRYLCVNTTITGRRKIIRQLH